jgi:hypothetical protein
MARLKVSLLMFAFFGFLAANTFFRFDIKSKPMHLLQGMIDISMTSWLGNTMAGTVLAMLAVGIPMLTMRKSYEPKAQLTINSTNTALRGKVYRPSEAELKAAGKPMFGKRG